MEMHPSLSHINSLGIHAIIRPSVSCDYHRLHLPLKYMGHKNVPMHDANVVLFNRDIGEYDETMMRGKRYIYDLDDHWDLYEQHYLYNSWQSYGMRERMIKFIKAAAVVTTTNSRLAKQIQQYNENVFIIPNAIPFGQEQFNESRPQIHSDVMRFVYAGGSSHYLDIKKLESPMENLRHENFSFKIHGYTPENENIWRGISNMFSNHQFKGLERARPVENYMGVYDEADVCLVPLESFAFNTYKSNLKLLEAGCKHLPVICSMSQSYCTPEDASYVDYCRHTADWVKQISYFIKNPSYAADRGHALNAHVKGRYNLQAANVMREQIYKYVYDRG